MILPAVKTRSVAITWLRALSVLYIVGYWHLLNFTSRSPGAIDLRMAQVTIMILGLFVFVSGFLLGSRNFSLERTDLVQFYRSRLLRIYPPYLVALVVFHFFGISRDRSLADGALLISAFIPPPLLTLWFIDVIIVYYLVTPILGVSAKKPLHYLFLCSALAGVALAYAGVTKLLDIRLILYFPAFAAGIFLAQHRDWIPKLHPVALAAMVAISAFFSKSPAMLETTYVTDFQALWCLPLALFGPIFCFVIASRFESILPSYWLIDVVSTASYFMYLFHRPLYQTLEWAYLPATWPHQVLYLVATGLPILIALSWYGQTRYDRLSRR